MNQSRSVHQFKATINIIGINPFVFVPDKVLNKIFQDAGKDKGPIPVCGTINGNDFQQTLVKYSGHWRLYINTSMLKNSPKRIGETVGITLAVDTADRTVRQHPKLTKALKENLRAKVYLMPFHRQGKKKLYGTSRRLRQKKALRRI